MLTWFPVVFWSRSNGNQNLVHPYTLDGLKVAGHGRQLMNNLMIWTICKYKDLPKFAPGFDFHLFEEESEDSI